MSLLKLKTALKTYLTSNSPSDVTEVVDFINDYVDASVTEYKTNIKNNCLNFGKWKGMTIKEVCSSEKGKDYLSWLLKQSWFSEEKNALLFDDLRTCGIIRTPEKTKQEAKEIVKEMERKKEIAEVKKPRAKKTAVSTPDFPSPNLVKEVEISA
jgi:hypothetical protein